MKAKWLYLLQIWCVVSADSYNEILAHRKTQCEALDNVFMSAMIGSSCFFIPRQAGSFLPDQKAFPSALTACKDRDDARLANFYTKNIWSKLHQLIAGNSYFSDLNNKNFWIGLKAKEHSSARYYWIVTSDGQMSAMDYLQQESLSFNPSNPLGTVQGGCIAMKVDSADQYLVVVYAAYKCARNVNLNPYICEKVAPAQKYTLKEGGNKFLDGSQFPNVTLSENDPWLCGLECLRHDGCVGYNYFKDGKCQPSSKKPQGSKVPLISHVGVDYYERYD